MKSNYTNSCVRTLSTHKTWALAYLSMAAWLLSLTGAANIAGMSSAMAQSAGWEHLPEIEAQIRAPQFPDQDFEIASFGAKSDEDALPAITKAIAACHDAGGGRVIVPSGTWDVSGPIHLQSNVNLHLQEGAVLKFGTNPNDYLPLVFTRFEGTELKNYSPLVYAFEQENIAVTGTGTLDGQAGPSKWWNWKGHWGHDTDIGWKEGDPDQRTDVEKLGELADAGVPPEEREFGAGHRLRPNFVQFYRCQNVLIEGITITNSPMWVIHPVLSKNVTVRGVTVDSHGPNNDGCNPESCQYVLIEECKFDTGDDCIAIKSGRNADGRRVNAPSQNIVVRNCQMKDGHGGVVLGSEMSGGIHNIYVEDCRMSSPNLERAIRLKSNSLRGGYLEHLYVRNIEVGEVSDAVVRINLEYWGESGDFPPSVNDIHLSDITSKKSKYPLYLIGIEGSPIKNVFLSRCSFRDASKPSIIEHVENLTYSDVSQPR